MFSLNHHQSLSRVIIVSGVSSWINNKKSWFCAQEKSKGDSTLTCLSSWHCRNWRGFFLAVSSILGLFCGNHHYLVKTLLLLSGYLKLLCFAYTSLSVPLFSLEEAFSYFLPLLPQPESYWTPTSPTLWLPSCHKSPDFLCLVSYYVFSPNNCKVLHEETVSYLSVIRT